MHLLILHFVSYFLLITQLDASDAENRHSMRNTSGIILSGTIQPYDESISNFTKRGPTSTNPNSKDLNQRDTNTYPINQCQQQCAGLIPDTASVFKSSLCDTQAIIPAWLLECTEPIEGQSSVGSNAFSPGSETGSNVPDVPHTTTPTSYACYGSCHILEVCVDFEVDGENRQAYCMDVFEGLLFKSRRPRDAQSAKIIPPTSLKRRKTNTQSAQLEVVLTRGKGTNLLFHATTISLRAIDANSNGIGHAVECENCGRLLYGPLPEDVAAIIAVVTLPNENDVAYITDAFYIP